MSTGVYGPIRATRDLGTNGLERDSSHFEVDRFINLAHAAAAHIAHDLEAAEDQLPV
jgi:hypothetical protein